MREAGRGHLIYISSISGIVPDVSGSAYQASKRGMIGKWPAMWSSSPAPK